MRALRLLAGLAAASLLLVVLALAALLIGLNTDPGRRLAERLTEQITGGQVVFSGLAGAFPAGPRLQRLQLRDPAGLWLTVEDAALDWSPLSLAAGEARISRLRAGRVVLARLPGDATPANPAEPPGSGGSFALPVPVKLARLQVDRLELGAPVAGVAAVLAAAGSARLLSLTTGEAALTLERLDGPGRYRLDLRLDAAAVSAHLEAEETTDGLAGHLAGLPQAGKITATAALDGPWNDAALSLVALAGPLRAEAAGRLDLPAMAGDLDLAVQAPPMRPREDLSWQAIALEAHVHGSFAAPEATASLRLDGLEAAGAGLRRLSVQASGHAGAAKLEADAAGIRLPGPLPGLLAAAPLHLTAEAGLDTTGRPLRFSLSHPLVTVAGTALTDGARSVEATITLPDLSPFAVAGMQGGAALTVKASLDGAGTNIDLDGHIGMTGGKAPLPGLLGKEAIFALSATQRGPDFSLSRLNLNGRAVTATAAGSLRGGVASLDWRLGLPDLKALSRDIDGALTAEGHAEGRPDDASLAVTATAGGTLDGAPLALAARATREADGALHLDLARADWRSLHAAGLLDLATGTVMPVGTMTASIGDLAEFSRLAGQRLTGRLDAALRTEQNNGAVVAVLDLKARHAGLPGQALVDDASLAARVRDPAGTAVTTAHLSVSGLRAGEIGGGLRLDASGPPAALVLALAAELTGVAGADLSATAAATLDGPARLLSVGSLKASRGGETLSLLAPARLSLAGGVAVDRLRLGLREAVLELAGRVTPTLDLTASLHDPAASLAGLAAPDRPIDGKLEAEAKLSGTPGRPTGTLRLAVSGLRARGGGAAGLPSAALSVSATLDNDTARLEAALTAATSRLTLAGTAGLAASGAIDLRAAGNADLASLDPILAAGGQRLRGRLTLDAAITGTVATPRAAGSLHLAGGEAQDVARGLRLTGIEAALQADGQTLRLTSLTARAGPGSIAATGSIGLAAPLPVALSLTARNASPLAGERLNAVLDADFSLRGEAAGRLDLTGKATLQRSDIRLPERLPAGLAVLKLRHPGQSFAAPPPGPSLDLGLDVTLASPGRLFVRGRGLDAELSGELHLGGTVAAPQPRGSFKLRRGQIALAGTILDFSRGEVGFDGSGSFDPTLNFLASSSNATVTATLAVTGYASAPKLLLSSTPELPQDEVLAWLLFHQSTATLSPLQLAQIAAALAQISGVDGGFDPLGAVRSGLGLDRLSVSGGEGGKGSAVEAGRYVAPGVYVGARQGTDGSGSQATVQIDLASGLKLRAMVGQSQGVTGAAMSGQESGSGGGISYQIEY